MMDSEPYCFNLFLLGMSLRFSFSPWPTVTVLRDALGAAHGITYRACERKFHATPLRHFSPLSSFLSLKRGHNSRTEPPVSSCKNPHVKPLFACTSQTTQKLEITHAWEFSTTPRRCLFTPKVLHINHLKCGQKWACPRAERGGGGSYYSF